MRLLSPTVEPFKIKVGETQTTRVKIESADELARVVAQVPFEGGSDEIVLSLVSGDHRSGIWEGTWVAHNTLTKEYSTRIIATDQQGNTQETTATWWDDTETVWLQGWNTRERIILTETGGSTLTDYKTQVTIPYQEEMQADFDDLRFTSADGNTLLGYYLESKTDSSTATFFVNIPSLPASADTSIYYYFGNATATSLSDVANAPAVGASLSYWTETSGADFSDGALSSALVFGSGNDAYVGLGPGANQYAFEKAITVTNSTANPLTAYQVKLTMDTSELITAGKMQSDCDDMRFYQSDRTTAIPYYLDSGCNTATTVIYLKTDLAASASRTVYFYYGNGASASGGSAANTFAFYDDLESGAVDTNKWDMKTGIGTNTIRTDDKYAGTYSVGSNQNGSQGLGIASYDQNHFMTKYPLTSFPVGATIVWKGYIKRWTVTTWGGHFGGFGVGGVPTDTTSEIADVSSGAWYMYETYITRTATDGWHFVVYQGTSLVGTYDRTKTFDTNFIYGIQTRHNNAFDNSILIRADNVSIRQYITNEPTCSVGTESMRTFTYGTAGNFISSTLDVGSASKFDSLDITVTAPANTVIKFQLAGNNDNATWSFVGPNGTGTDYYTADSTTFPAALQGKRFLKFKAYLESTDSAATSQLNGITIGYLSYAGTWSETSTADFSDGAYTNTAASNGNLELATGVGVSWEDMSATWGLPASGGNDYTSTAFADLDNDGDLDVLKGTGATGLLTAYENTGSASSPVWTARSGWDGPSTGYTYVAPALADLDNDGDFDLMRGDANGAVLAFRNTGTVNSPIWTAQTSWNTPDVGANAYPAFADLDNDGDIDLMIGESAGITLGYRNSGSVSSPTWVAQTSWNTINAGGGYSAPPALGDMDGDGDYDLILGDVEGHCDGYKNTGTVSSPTWSSFTPWNGPLTLQKNVPVFVDLDNDGDQDLMVGGREANPVIAFRNNPVTIYGTSGNNITPAGNYVSAAFDVGTTSKFDSLFSTRTLPATTTAKFQVAVNTDNSTWNFVGPDNTASTYYTANSNFPSVLLLGQRYMKYKAYLETTNVAVTPAVQDIALRYTKVWQQTTTADFSGGTLSSVTAASNNLTLTGTASPDPTWVATSGWNTADIGTSTAPGLADLDNDGDLDAMIGLSGGSAMGYKNTGSTSSPTWTEEATWESPDPGARGVPALADLDNDGDKDLLLGETVGNTNAYKNTGTASSPTWTAEAGWVVADLGANSAPALADLDNDGDKDLLIGLATGAVVAYRNTGSASAPTWTAYSTWNVTHGTFSVPALGDIDRDGDFDLLLGDADGITYGYKNTGTVSAPTWTATTSWNVADIGASAAPALGDLDNDGDLDLLIGSDAGVDYGYKNTPVITYSASGNLVSSAFDGTVAVNLGFIYFNKTTPANTLVKFQLATNNDNATWNFTGPDGTASTYYTTDTESTRTSLDLNRYVKYKAYLETTNTAATPTLSDFAIGYVASPRLSSGASPITTFSTQMEVRPHPGATGVSGDGFLGF